jgi:hypothetical protein
MMSFVYGENWQEFEERISLERAHRNLLAAQAEQEKQRGVTPTKQRNLRCCYNCKYCKEVEYEDTHMCNHPLVNDCVEPTDMCAYVVIRSE